MARLVLHVGTHKTATTTIQDVLHANRALLAEHGVIYPALGQHSGHHGLLTDWIALPPPYALPEGGIGTLHALAGQYRSSDITLVLSSEEFSRAGHGGQVDLAALRAIFEGFEKISVICVLREQWQFLQSVYLEIARNRIPALPTELIAQAIETGQIDGLWCDYCGLYETLRTGFEPDEITLVDFAAARLHRGGILGHFLEVLGLPFGSDALKMVNAGISNVSPLPLPRWAALMVAGGHGLPLSAQDMLAGAIAETFALEFGRDRPNCLFTRAEHESLAARFGPRNTRLGAQIAPYQPGFRLPVTRPPKDTIYREDIGASFWLRLARRLILLPQNAGTVPEDTGQQPTKTAPPGEQGNFQSLI